MIPHRPSTLAATCPCGAEVRAGKGYFYGRLLCAHCAIQTAPVDPHLEARLVDTYNGSWEVAPYQATGSRFLASRWDALLSDRMGLGKTAEACLALPPGCAVVICCPAQVKTVWQRELEIWCPEFRPYVLQGRSSWRAPKVSEVVILNYDILPPVQSVCVCGCPGSAHTAKSCACKHCQGFRGKLPDPEAVRKDLGLLEGTILICDEAHKVKNLTATRTKRVRYLRQGCARSWALTASPIMNHPRELWAIYRVFGLDRAAFPGGARVYNALTKFYDDYTKSTPEVRALFREGRSRVELGRSADDVGLELPELRFEERLVPITMEARQAIEDALGAAIAKHKAMALYKAGEIEKEDIVERARLLCYTSHTDEDVVALLEAVMSSTSWSDCANELATLRRALSVAKIPAAIEFAKGAKDAGEPLVAFSAHVAPVEALAGIVGWESLRNQSKRASIIDRFQAGELAGVAGTIRGGSEGITLTRARLLLFVDQDWTPEANTQALKRIHRIGQHRASLVTTLVADHIVDRYVAAKLERKQGMISALAQEVTCPTA